MGLETLLGNEQLKKNLRTAIDGRRISHGYLISGPKGAGKHTLARLLAMAAVCREDNRPCGTCSGCRKVLSGNHADVITVDDPGKKTVSVDLVRQARADMYVKPNEAGKKVYLFPRAQDMRVEAQNALLKVLEEPPAYGIFLLLADAPEKMLPTVRSRCVELKLQALSPELLEKELKREFPQASQGDISAAISASGGFLGQAQERLRMGVGAAPQTKAFAEAYATADAVALLRVLVPMEKWKREDLLQMLHSWRDMLICALSCRAGMETPNPLSRQVAARRSAVDIREAVSVLEKAVEYTQSNVSPGAICGWLAWELR